MTSQKPPAKDNVQTIRPKEGPHKPVEKFREGRVHVSIWENTGVNGAFRTASFELRFRKGDEWQTGTSYGLDDLAYLELAAKQARTRIEQWKRAQAGDTVSSRPL